MIKANELRIGNWFINYDDKPFQWSLNDFNSLFAHADLDEIIKSEIPLTPEILEQAGFNTGSIFWKTEKDIKISIGGGKANIASNFSTSEIFTVDVKYLHQLQNLYFALTGEELEIKLYEKV